MDVEDIVRYSAGSLEEEPVPKSARYSSPIDSEERLENRWRVLQEIFEMPVSPTQWTIDSHRSFQQSVVLFSAMCNLGWTHSQIDNPKWLTAMIILHATKHRDATDASNHSWPEVIGYLDQQTQNVIGRLDELTKKPTYHDYLITEAFLQGFIAGIRADSSIDDVWQALKHTMRETEMDLWYALSTREARALPNLEKEAKDVNNACGELLDLPFKGHSKLFIGLGAVVLVHGGKYLGFQALFNGEPQSWYNMKVHHQFQERHGKDIGNHNSAFKYDPKRVYRGKITNNSEPGNNHVIKGGSTNAMKPVALRIDGVGFQDEGVLHYKMQKDQQPDVTMQLVINSQFPAVLFGWCYPKDNPKRYECGITPEMCKVLQLRTFDRKETADAPHGASELRLQWPHVSLPKQNRDRSCRTVEVMIELHENAKIRVTNRSTESLENLSTAHGALFEALHKSRQIMVLAHFDDASDTVTIEWMRAITESAMAHVGMPCSAWSYIGKYITYEATQKGVSTACQVIEGLIRGVDAKEFPVVPVHLLPGPEQDIGAPFAQLALGGGTKICTDTELIRMALAAARSAHYAFMKKEQLDNTTYSAEIRTSVIRGKQVACMAEVTLPNTFATVDAPEPGDSVKLTFHVSRSGQVSYNHGHKRQMKTAPVNTKIEIYGEVVGGGDDCRTMRVSFQPEINTDAWEFCNNPKVLKNRQDINMKFLNGITDTVGEALTTLRRLQSLASEDVVNEKLDVMKLYMEQDSEAGHRELSQPEYSPEEARFVNIVSSGGIPDVEALYPAQRKAFDAIVSQSNSNNFVEIQGPPGTGKSVAGMRPPIILALRNNVMIAAQDNVVADAAIAKIRKTLAAVGAQDPALVEKIRLTRLHPQNFAHGHEEFNVLDNVPPMCTGPQNIHQSMYDGYAGKDKDLSLDRLAYLWASGIDSEKTPEQREASDKYRSYYREFRKNRSDIRARKAFEAAAEVVIQYVLNETNILVGTIHTLNKLLSGGRNWTPSTTFIDEAGKVSFLQSLKVMCGRLTPDSLQVIGDTHQTGVIELSEIAKANEFGMSKLSVMEALNSNQKRDCTNKFVLDENRRNPPAVWAYSQKLYKRKTNVTVRSVKDVSGDPVIEKLNRMASGRNFFGDMIYRNSFRFDEKQQLCIDVQHCAELMDLPPRHAGIDVTFTDSNGDLHDFGGQKEKIHVNKGIIEVAVKVIGGMIDAGVAASDILVMTTSKRELKGLRQRLDTNKFSELRVSSTTGVQGEERPVTVNVIQGCGHGDYRGPAAATLNVLATRASTCSIWIMNSNCILNDNKPRMLKDLKALAMHMQEHGEIRNWPAEIEDPGPHPGRRYQRSTHADDMDNGRSDPNTQMLDYGGEDVFIAPSVPSFGSVLLRSGYADPYGPSLKRKREMREEE